MPAPANLSRSFHDARHRKSVHNGDGADRPTFREHGEDTDAAGSNAIAEDSARRASRAFGSGERLTYPQSPSRQAMIAAVTGLVSSGPRTAIETTPASLAG